jgi:hypothetical protein
MTVSSPAPPPPPGYPQAPKKGLSPLAWIGIGCGVILVLGVIALGAIGFFVKKKVDEVSKNPTMAAAEVMVRMNPDLELVSKDEAHNTLTIKDKKTGEVTTFSAEDAKNGNFTIKTDKGTATFGGATGGTDGGGTLKVTDDKGQVSTFNAGAGTPQNLPSWLPVYPGGAVQGTFDTTGPEGRSAAFTVTTTDPVSKVMEFYKAQLEGAGLKVDQSTFSSNGQNGGTLSAKSDDEKRQAGLLFGTADGKTSATVTFQEKQ